MRLRTFAIAAAAAALALAPLVAQSDEPTPMSTDPVAEDQASGEAADTGLATSPSTELDSEPVDSSTVELGATAPEAEPVTTGLDSEAPSYDADPYGEATIPQEPANEPSELPRTASPLALLALLGAGGIGSAAGLRFARRR